MAGSTQRDFFGSFAEDQLAKPAKPTQDVELTRVTGKTAAAIELFFEAHQHGETFHCNDLHRFVSEQASVAPASADRVMRNMRSVGQVNYELVSRRESLYRVLKSKGGE